MMRSGDVTMHRSVIGAHRDYRDWLEHHLDGPEAFGVSELVLSAFLRVVTNHRFQHANARGYCAGILRRRARFAGHCDRAAR